MLSSYTPYVVTRLTDRREHVHVRAMTPTRRRAGRRAAGSPGGAS
ncbi:MAG: hypothetical protein ACRDQD_21775 [Nocardioidaceae bacterium]